MYLKPCTQHNAERADAGVLQQYLGALQDGDRVPVAQFIDACRAALNLRPAKDGVTTWRALRSTVLHVADEALYVETTAGRTALGEHDVTTAGLVTAPILGGNGEPLHEYASGGNGHLTYERAMLDAYGLVDVDGVPTTLRGFCGQYSAGDIHQYELATFGPWADEYLRGERTFPQFDELLVEVGRTETRLACIRQWYDLFHAESVPLRPAWADHARVWQHTEGHLILSFEVSGHIDHPALLKMLESDIIDQHMPLILAGDFRPSLLYPSRTLVMFRWNVNAPPLSSEYTPMIWDLDSPNDESPWRPRYVWEV